jgi:hypothetical protein
VKRRFVHTETTRHGKTVHYFRRNGASPRIRLPDDAESEEFSIQYFNALAGREVLLPPSMAEQAAIDFSDQLERSVKRLAHQAKVRANRKGLECTISASWAIEQLRRQGNKCSLSGIYFDHTFSTGGFMRPFSPSIDQIKPQGGYTPENCRIIVTAMNVMLSDWGEEIFEQVARGYRREMKRIRNTKPRT